jgi:MoaA/NifB/PqqE/SkfB family radical SAM enzyme
MGLISRAIGRAGYLLLRETGYYRTRPANMVLFLTYRCTSRCAACSMWKRPISGEELTLEEWQKFIGSVPYKIRNIEMFGGDALLRKETLIPLIRYCRKRGIPEVDLVTNANLLDEKTAKELIKAGISTVTVSMDGIGRTHEKVRGMPESFEKVTHGLEYLLRYRNVRQSPLIVANCTVSKLNAGGITEIAEYAEALGVDVAAFEYVGEFPRETIARSEINGIAPTPYYLAQNNSLLLNIEEARELKKNIAGIKKHFKDSKMKLFTRNIDILRPEDMVKGTFPFTRCYVCRYYITVDPYGNILPCLFYHNYQLGNIRKTKFVSLWKNEKHRAFMKRAGKTEMCRHCILAVERNASLLQAAGKSLREI